MLIVAISWTYHKSDNKSLGSPLLSNFNLNQRKEGFSGFVICAMDYSLRYTLAVPNLAYMHENFIEISIASKTFKNILFVDSIFEVKPIWSLLTFKCLVFS